MKHSLIHYSFFLLLTAGILTLASCANIIPPGGGLRDSLPPRLVASVPKDSALNVTTKNITLSFDEFVTLQGVNENLIVSPSFQNMPLVDYKLRNLTIKLKDSLEPNTTYSFNFGDAIKDVNEGNIAKGLTYVFSTGNTIDLNTYSGKVLLAENGKVDSSLVVVLHNNLSDTAIVKINPRYYTRINGRGEFHFQYLPRGNFAVYVVPNGFSKKYTDSTQLFAFRNGPVTIDGNTPNDTLYVYEEFKRSDKPFAASGSNRIVAIKEDKRLRFSTSLENGQQDILSDMFLHVNRPVTRFDSSGFVLYDTNFHKLSGYTLALDTGKTKINLHYNWKQETPFILLVDKEAIADSSGITLAKTDTIRFYTKREADYGSVRLMFNNLNLSRNPVLQFVIQDRIVESVALTSNLFTRKFYRPGTYDLRILYDTNKNGVWDPGHFPEPKRQPEIVQLIPRPLQVKANWDNEVTISL